jgi:hypothetical protein
MAVNPVRLFASLAKRQVLQSGNTLVQEESKVLPFGVNSEDLDFKGEVRIYGLDVNGYPRGVEAAH